MYSFFRTYVAASFLRPVAWINSPLSSIRRALPNKLSPSDSRAYSDRRLRGRFIPHRVVQLADSESGKLLPPSDLQDIIAAIDQKTHFVELVAEVPSPIVRIVDRRVAAEKNRQRKAAAKAHRIAQKEIQITWSVEPGDLEHKFKKILDELEKGNKVDIVFATKKGQQPPPPPQMAGMVERTVSKFRDVATEWKPREIHKRMAVIYLRTIPGSRKES